MGGSITVLESTYRLWTGYGEITIGSDTYYLPVTLLMAACVILPVLVSPLETLIAQLDQLRSNKIKGFLSKTAKLYIKKCSGSTFNQTLAGY